MNKKLKIVLVLSLVIAGILVILLPTVYHAYSTVTECRSFITKPNAAVKACADLVEISHRPPEKLDSEDAYEVLWLHLAHARLGQNDQQQFEHNSAPHLSRDWPAPILAFFLGKISLEDVFAEAKTGDQDTQNDNICDANFYAGEWYLLNNMKDKAQAAFQTAHGICKSDQITAEWVTSELKTRSP
jgi:hypothetical protein